MQSQPRIGTGRFISVPDDREIIGKYRLHGRRMIRWLRGAGGLLCADPGIGKARSCRNVPMSCWVACANMASNFHNFPLRGSVPVLVAHG